MSGSDSSSGGSDTDDSVLDREPIRIRGPLPSMKGENDGAASSVGIARTSTAASYNSGSQGATLSKTAAGGAKKANVMAATVPDVLRKNASISAEFVDDSDLDSGSGSELEAQNQPSRASTSTTTNKPSTAIVTATASRDTESRNSEAVDLFMQAAQQRSSAKASSSTALTKPKMGSSRTSKRRSRLEGPEIIDGVFKLCKAESAGEAVQFFAESRLKRHGVWIISGPAATEMNFDLETTVLEKNNLSKNGPQGMKFCIPISSKGGDFEKITACTVTLVRSEPDRSLLPQITQAFDESEPAAPMQPKDLKKRWDPIGHVEGSVKPEPSSVATPEYLATAEDVMPTPSQKEEKRKRKKKRKVEDSVEAANLIPNEPPTDVQPCITESPSKKQRKLKELEMVVHTPTGAQLASSPIISAMKDSSKKAAKKKKSHHVAFVETVANEQPMQPPTPEKADLPIKKKRKSAAAVQDFLDHNAGPKTQIQPPVVPGMPE